jgi:uncharacterized protein (DUF1684 family)
VTAAQELLDLADWRRRVGNLYRSQGDDALARFRTDRDDLFRKHPQSPIPVTDRAAFKGLSYFAGDAAYRVRATLEAARDEGEGLEIDTGGEDGVIRYRRAGRLHFQLGGQPAGLTLFWLHAYGGGLFLPFRDRTAGRETYGAGRYLVDGAKGTDGLCIEFAIGSREVLLDFNFAYNPSCAYDPAWTCPLAPPGNVLPAPLPVGELWRARPWPTDVA